MIDTSHDSFLLLCRAVQMLVQCSRPGAYWHIGRLGPAPFPRLVCKVVLGCPQRQVPAPAVRHTEVLMHDLHARLLARADGSRVVDFHYQVCTY